MNKYLKHLKCRYIHLHYILSPLTAFYRSCLMFLPIFLIKCMYTIVVVVKDHTSMTSFVLFDKPADKIVKKKNYTHEDTRRGPNKIPYNYIGIMWQEVCIPSQRRSNENNRNESN